MSRPREPRPTSVIGGVLRSAVHQAAVDVRSALRGWGVVGYAVTFVILLLAVFLVGGSEVGPGGITGAQYVLPSLLAATLVLTGFAAPSGELVTEREDGSLLRMKAIPRGLQGYVVGKMLSVLTMTVVPLVITLIIAIIVQPELAPESLVGWLRLSGFVILGLFAAIPVGIAFGSLIRSAVAMAVPTLLIYGLIAISGVFFPLDVLPGWLQTLAQVFPIYWLALGMRSAFLPAEAVVLELGGSWHTFATFAVLGGWAALGLVLAPLLLRRMVRGISGSTVSAARDRVLSRGY